MTDNYKLVKISEVHYKKFNHFNIIYRVDIINGLTIDDYYSILNKIIELNKDKNIEENIEIKINISITDKDNPRMNFKTQLLNINEITPDHLLDLIEMNSEDDDDFHIGCYTIFTIQKIIMS